jgi:hypothetical protein
MMIRSIPTSLALLLVLTGIAFAQPRVTGQINVDPVAIGQAISGAVTTAQNREAFVKDCLNRMVYATRGKYYMMVFNMRQGYVFNPNPGSSYYRSANYGALPMGSGLSKAR